MDGPDQRQGVLEPDPALSAFRLPRSESCWWCGDAATTEEHRIKASTLRRVARADNGTAEPGNVFKKSSDYEGPLRTLNKGSQVRWRRNLCANCNNSRSQPFDRAYDVFETFIVSRFRTLAEQPNLDWRDVYGDDWRAGATALGRYFAKQLGCMLATYDLPVPEDLRRFVSGADRCPSVCFALAIEPRVVALLRSGDSGGDLSNFVGLLNAPAYRSGDSLTGIDYGYHIGYLNFIVCWREGAQFASWFDNYVCELPWLEKI